MGDPFAQNNSMFSEKQISPREETYRGGSPDKSDFPEPPGSKRAHGRKRSLVDDDGMGLSPRRQQLRDRQPKKRGMLAVDPVCLSCTKHQADIIKSFKIACLAYAPSNVIFRNIEFTRS